MTRQESSNDILLASLATKTDIASLNDFMKTSQAERHKIIAGHQKLRVVTLVILAVAVMAIGIGLCIAVQGLGKSIPDALNSSTTPAANR